jgi:Rho-binding antiterminator
MTTQYQKISCSFYDQLEALATKRTHCSIIFRNHEKEETAEGVIVDLFSKDAAEFLQLDKGITIRLDHLVSLNGIPLNFVC